MEEQEISADLLAELQYDDNGHRKGIPDISIPFVHSAHNGVAVILKLNDDCHDYQKAHVKYLEDVRNYKVLISDDYDHITEMLIEFFSNARFICPHCDKGCRRRYRTLESRESHVRNFHHSIASSSSSDNLHRDPP